MPTDQIDPREYAATRGITIEAATAELERGTPNEHVPIPGVGHNQGPTWAQPATQQVADPDTAALTMAARDKLRLVVSRVEALEEEKKEISGQIKDVLAEAKSMGYDVSAIRAMIRERKQDPQERAEREAILDVYRSALGEKD